MAPVEHRIFVSHSHLDNDFGTRLAQDLRRVLAGEDAVFYDVLGGLHGGERWWEKIVEELTARDLFLLVLSDDAMNSLWVRREIDVALNENKYIIPLLHRTCTIRADLKILQIISFLAPKTYDAAFQEVLGALGLPKTPPETLQESTSHLHQPPDLTAILTQQLEEAFADHDWPDVIRKASFLIKRTAGNVPSLVYRLQGLALLEEGEVEQAQEALETALALASDRRQRLTMLSDYTALLARQDQWTRVLQQAREALRLVPNDPGWLATQQQAQSQLTQQAPAALPSQKKKPTTDQDPSLLPLKTIIPWIDEDYELKRSEEDLVACDQAIQLDPNSALAYNNKGNALNNLKRYKEAIAAYDQAIRLDPNNAIAYFNKGNALERLGRKKDAQKAFKRARNERSNRSLYKTDEAGKDT
jgi:tetratricopeptide (TPR) repeat protein